MPTKNAFGHICPDHIVGTDCSAHTKLEFSPVLDKETGSIIPTVTGEIDLDELTQTYEPSCGMNAVKKIIARGGDISMFADDGQHSADCTGPQSLNEAYMAYQSATAYLNSNGLGSLTEDQVNAMIKKQLDEALAKTQAPQSEGVKE